MSIFRGIKEIGTKAGAVRTPLGNITKDGVKVQVQTNEQVIESALSDLPIDVLVNSTSITLTGTFQSGDLDVIKFAFGLPDSAIDESVVGSEVLTIGRNQIGSMPAVELYVLASGPNGFGTREYVFHKAKVQVTGDMSLGRDEIVTVPFKVSVLDNGTSPAVTIDNSAA